VQVMDFFTATDDLVHEMDIVGLALDAASATGTTLRTPTAAETAKTETRSKARILLMLVGFR